MNKQPKKEENKGEKDITRRKALKKAGKYSVWTASVMLTVLSPKASQATSPVPPPPPKW